MSLANGNNIKTLKAYRLETFFNAHESGELWWFGDKPDLGYVPHSYMYANVEHKHKGIGVLIT